MSAIFSILYSGIFSPLLLYVWVCMFEEEVGAPVQACWLECGYGKLLGGLLLGVERRVSS